MYTFHSRDGAAIDLSLPPDRVRVSDDGEEPARYREVQSRTVTFREGTFRTDDAVLAGRIRRESGFGTWYTEASAAPPARRRRRAAAPGTSPDENAPATDPAAEAPVEAATPDGPNQKDADEKGAEGATPDGPNQKEGPNQVRIAYGVTSLVGAAEVLMASPYGVEAADLTDARGKLNPARVRAAADADRVVFPDLFGEG